MDNNLIPPFIMREAGIEVNEVPKIHAIEPSIEHHSIYFRQDNLRIPLALWGIFSYFPTRKPTEDDMSDNLNLLMLTPDGPDWNPHSDVYARNEEQFLDWKGDLIQPQYRQRVLIDDTDTDAFLSDLSGSSTDLTTSENLAIDHCCEQALVMSTTALCLNDHLETPAATSVQAGAINSTLDLTTFASNLVERGAYSKFGMSIGSMHCTIDDVNDLFTSDITATHAEPPKGVSAKHLAKVWKIDLESAKRTLEVTSQCRPNQLAPPRTSGGDMVLR